MVEPPDVVAVPTTAVAVDAASYALGTALLGSLLGVRPVAEGEAAMGNSGIGSSSGGCGGGGGGGGGDDGGGGGHGVALPRPHYLCRPSSPRPR